MCKIYDEIVNCIITNQEKFYRVAYSYVYNREAALDIVQNTICKALESFESLRNPYAVKTWVYKIIINESLLYIKKNKKEFVSDFAQIPEEVYEEEGYEPDSELFYEVSKLPKEQKTVVILHYYEELTLKEIAKVTGSNENTVKSRLYSALKKLEKTVKEAV